MLQQLTRARPFVVQPDAPTVMVTGYFYAVDLGDPVRPRHHRVGINGECACPLGRQCPAVDAVRAHLADGGERADVRRLGFIQSIPRNARSLGAGPQLTLTPH